MTPYALGALWAVKMAGILDKPVSHALIGSLTGGALGALRPEWFGTEDLPVGVGLGALLGGGAGLGVHGVRSYFKKLREAGEPILEREAEEIQRSLDELSRDLATGPLTK